jgi:hypothetical protein
MTLHFSMDRSFFSLHIGSSHPTLESYSPSPSPRLAFHLAMSHTLLTEETGTEVEKRILWHALAEYRMHYHQGCPHQGMWYSYLLPTSAAT